MKQCDGFYPIVTVLVRDTEAMTKSILTCLNTVSYHAKLNRNVNATIKLSLSEATEISLCVCHRLGSGFLLNTTDARAALPVTSIHERYPHNYQKWPGQTGDCPHTQEVTLTPL